MFYIPDYGQAVQVHLQQGQHGPAANPRHPLPHLPPRHPRQLVRGQGPHAHVPPTGLCAPLRPRHSDPLQQDHGPAR